MIHNVARILEQAVPLMEHPGESFMAQLEEDMMKLILKHGMMVRAFPMHLAKWTPCHPPLVTHGDLIGLSDHTRDSFDNSNTL